ncbi:MAG: hypothetical protein Ct9H90mP4_06660 [Gammaproteobacteria bacterium]|nr:MAG: hypothetical protein Ct9H90mP4_06660 [Gammaproteobacteria bacterium]
MYLYIYFLFYQLYRNISISGYYGKMQSKENLDSIKEFLNQSNIDYVKVAITDIDGVLRGKYMHKDKFLKACESGLVFVMLFLVGIVTMTYTNQGIFGMSLLQVGILDFLMQK